MSNLMVACIGDTHVCPIPGHGSSPIVANGATANVDGMPIARVGDACGCGAMIAQGYPLALLDGRPLAHMGSPTSHGGQIITGKPRVILGVATLTAPVVDFAKAGALNSQGQLTSEATQALDKDPFGFVEWAKAKGALVDAGLEGATPEEIKASKRYAAGQSDLRPKVTVEAGIFFDGTGNSRDNTGTFERRVDECLTAQAAGAISEEACSAEISQLMEGSYLNAETNVAKLHDLYLPFSTSTLTIENHRFPVYVSGVGTKSGKEDDAWAMGTGMGERGVLAKIELAVEQLSSDLSDMLTAQMNELILDVFGFSRGAATARHFVNEVRDGADGALGQAFQKLGIAWPKTVTVRFLGMFDTVAAVVDILGADFSAHNANNGEVRVDIAADSVQRAVHLTARDEWRHNFSLNSLRGPDGSLPAHFDEWVLPGAHSDIGGGYPDNFQERIQVALPRRFSGRRPRDSFEYTRILLERKRITSEGWLGLHNPDGTLTIEEAYRRRLKEGEVELQFRLWLDRRVKSEYSRIALRQMYRLAADVGVPFKNLNPALKKYALPDELQSIATRITLHINEGRPLQLTAAEEALLRQRYIHHSAHYQIAGPLFPFKPAPDMVRGVHPNRGLK
ncbi:phospholipase effector Tle1 domain-containing protein [Marinobacter sp.]|uniref:phospholipase effector Tle1 domain-containing protein n=3 Tax=Marinobacter sp. TaxID=50741 RepID=UPI003F9E18AC